MPSVTAVRRPSESDLINGFLAGLAGGVAGSGVKILGELLYPPRPPTWTTPPAKLGDKIARHTTGHGLTAKQKGDVEQALHWTFGPLAGGIYGLAVEAWPFAGVGYGLGFATILWAATHESTLPALDLADPPTKATSQEQLSELFTHGLYAVTVEFVRRLIRRRQA